jgi:hypothetical protein
LRRFALIVIAAVFAFDCGSVGAASSRPIGSFNQPVYLTSEHGRLLLSAKRLRPGGSRFKVKVRLDPCLGRGGLPVQLSRNGKSFASKRLRGNCWARFWLTVAKPTPIRAFVRLGDEGERVGSRQLKLMPPKQS